MKEFFFILLISMVTAIPTSIGSCQTYSNDGQQCQLCIPNYHLFQGSCYVDILGCQQYQFGNICHQCQKNYILVNNMCCDMVCMSKIFSKFKKEVKEEVIASNTDILAQLIPFVQTQYINGTTSRLIAIQVKENLEAKRFFLLYEFYETQIYTKRLIIDYVYKSKKYVILDWSIIKNTWKFSTVEWEQVDDDASILTYFPKLYPTGQSYDQIVARKALLGLIDQYELLTLVGDKMLVRILYDNKGEVVILRESESIQTKPIDIATENSVTNDNAPSTTNTTNTSTSTSTPISNTTSSTTPSTPFTPYELKYMGNDILTQYKTNEPLKLSFNLIQSDQYWNHTVSMVVETGKVSDIIQFLFIGENNVTGSVIKYSIKYNVPTKETFIVSISEEFVTVTQQVVAVNTTITTGTSTSTSTSTSSTTNTTITVPSVPIVQMTESKVFIIEEGCTTHTFYIIPFAPEIQAISSNLKSLRTQYFQANPTELSPSIHLNTLITRRIVATENGINSNYREVALVESDSTTSTWEYFTYYLEIQSPLKKTIYLGTKNKTQTLQIYTSPYAYPIYVSDPSFLLYPAASLFYQTTVSSLFISNLSSSDSNTFKTLTPIATSQKDRQMGKVNRFTIDGVNNVTNYKYRLIGWRVIGDTVDLPTGNVLSLIVPNGNNTQPLIINSNGLATDITTTLTNILNNIPMPGIPSLNISVPSVNISLPSLNMSQPIINNTLNQIKVLYPTTQQPITTSILTSFIGDPTVQTTNIKSMISEDTVLQQILQKLLTQKPFIKDYYLSNLVITEYNQALQYHLQFRQSNINRLANFIATNWILSVVIHDKIKNENLIISFDVKNLTNVINTGGLINGSMNYSNTYNGGYVDGANLINIGNITGGYVIVNVPVISTNVTSNYTVTTNHNISTINTTTNPSTPLSTNISSTTTQQSLNQINIQQRIKQLLQIILIQLKTSYGISTPSIIQLLKQINDLSQIVKLDLIVEDTVSKTNYSVIAIGQLLTKVDPIIESVKPITQDVVDKVIDVATSVVSTTPIVNANCTNTNVNTGGQQASSGQTTSATSSNTTSQTTTTQTNPSPQTTPGTSSNTTTQINTPTTPPSNTSSTSTTSSNTSNTTTSTTPTIPQPSIPISAPSSTVVQMVQQKSYEQTTQSTDGQIRKIYVNPTESTLSPQIQQALSVVKKEQLRLQQTQGITISPHFIVKSVELSATTIYIHYAITIKIVFTQTVIIRRYYVIYSLNSTIVDPVHMGHEDMPLDFDPSLKENRAFKDLILLENNDANSGVFNNTVNYLNSKYNVKYTIIDIVYYYYRVFPIGRYVKVTIKDLSTVGNLHIILMNNGTSQEMKWHSEVIDKLMQNVTTTTTTGSTTTPVSNQTTSSSTSTTPLNTQTTNNTSTSTTTPFVPTTPTTTNTTSTHTTSNATSTTTSTASTNTTITPSSTTSSDTTSASTSTTTITNTSTTSSAVSSTPAPTPQQVINKQQAITNTSKVVISLTMQQKLAQVLKYLSDQKGSQLQGGSLQQYAATQDKSSDGTVNAVQFDFYFLKFISQQLLREFICSAIRQQGDGKIDIALFISNDIDLSSNQTTTTETPSSTNTTSSSKNTSSSTQTSTTTTTVTNGTTTTTTTSLQTVVQQQQVHMNANITIVDPNQLNYPQAISLVDQDPLKQSFDQVLDFNNLPSYIDDIIKFIRAKYTIIINSQEIKIIRSLKTTTIQRFRIYFFKQYLSSYILYRTIIDYNTSTPQTQYSIVSFDLYAQNNALATQPKITDLSIQDDTDLAYGYVNVQMQSISTNQNIQSVLSYLNKKYHTIVRNKTVVKIEELKLLDGRINYKILYRDPVELSEFKFIIFYQPQLQKVLVLNSVNLPHHSQYNQLTSDQQKSDTVFNSVLSYMNSIHPQLSGFTVRSVSKAVQTNFSEYQLFIQFQNKKYKSLIRIATNNVDMTEINFSQQVEISLDHYKLDQFDEMFIMNYQKISEDQIRTNSKLRMILSYLYSSHQVPNEAEFLGAAFKPFSLGFLYKTFFKIGLLQQLTAAQVYIEAYSDKITLKSMKNISFDDNLLTITAQQNIMTKIIALIKQKSKFTDFTVQTVGAKDFLYGTLYKYTISPQNGIFDIVVYHDHSTEEILLLFVRENQSQDQCVYQGTTCGSCKSTNFRVQNNKCVQILPNCLTYQTDSEYCATCDSNSDLTNGICLVKANCGALCQLVSV